MNQGPPDYEEVGKYYIYTDGYPTTTNWWNTKPDGCQKISSENIGSYYIEKSNGSYSNISNEYEDKYYVTSGSPKSGYDYVEVVAYKRTTKSVITKAPYLFFYNVDLNGKLGDTKAAEGLKVPYNVDLDWTTAIDKFKDHSAVINTKYTGANGTMKEKYVLSRSIAGGDWTVVPTAENADITNTASKTLTDETVIAPNEQALQLGFSVQYKITSVLCKPDGTEMVQCESNTVTVTIPGEAPFMLNLDDKSTVKYQPGSGSGVDYVDGVNSFNYLLSTTYNPNHKQVSMETGAQLELVRISDGTVLKTVTAGADGNLEDLEKTMGSQPDEFTPAAGSVRNAEYQLVLTAKGKKYYSNIVKYLNEAPVNGSVICHRSGYVDQASRLAGEGETEYFRNEIVFKPTTLRTGTGYVIYRDGTPVYRLSYSGVGTKFYIYEGDEMTTKIGEVSQNAEGNIVVADGTIESPVKEGENISELPAEPAVWNYAIMAYSDDDLNAQSTVTIGSKAAQVQYVGAESELVVKPEITTSTAGYSLKEIYCENTITINLNKTHADVVKPVKYIVYAAIPQFSWEGGSGVDPTEGALQPSEVDAYTPVHEVLLSEGETSAQFTHGFIYDRNPEGQKWEAGKVLAPTESELKSVNYYVKAIYTNDEANYSNATVKNSIVVTSTISGGNVFTSADAILAEAEVTVESGIITVKGAEGPVVVYTTAGAEVARGNGDGTATAIDASSLSGVYIVKAQGMKPTKILIK